MFETETFGPFLVRKMKCRRGGGMAPLAPLVATPLSIVERDNLEKEGTSEKGRIEIEDSGFSLQSNIT